METVSRSRADIALPNPQELPSEPGIELSEVPSHEDTQPGRTVRSPPRQTWLTFLKKELEFLGFAISGFLSVMSEKNHAAYLVHGSLGANLVSSIAAVAGFIILIANLKNSLAYISFCQEASVDDFCSAVFFSTEIVATILFLTILGFGAAVALTVYRVGELFKRDKSLEERLYEELNIYSPIYSELEALPPTDT
uniref:Membrane spanning 4-domains A2 n=1 Tax=Rousettus aegyptiacus TaxID=9407 RepID=A0A7J8H2I7_ROUAE|nr:membrane spanning 4-domains A2 [Rousettus aegyptiacus]